MAQEEIVSKPITVFAFGASLTAGYGYDEFHPYTDWIAEATQGRFVPHGNYGVPGETTAQIRQRCIRAVKAQSATATETPSEQKKVVFVVQGGTNDVGLGVPEDETISNLSEVATACISQGIPVVLCTIPPLAADAELQLAIPEGLTAKRQRINRALFRLRDQVANPKLLGIFDFYEAVSVYLPHPQPTQTPTNSGSDSQVRVLRDDLRIDSMHLTKEGYRLMGFGIGAALLQLL
jgi:lysophospholipase L1-like esterase